MLPLTALLVVVATQIPPPPPAPPAPPGALSVRPPRPPRPPLSLGEDGLVLLREGRSIVSNADPSVVDSLRAQGGEVLWFERQGKAWIVRDADAIARVAGLFEPQIARAREQAKLAKEQARLAGKQARLAARRLDDGRAAREDEQETLSQQQESLGEQQEALGDEQERETRAARAQLGATLDELIRSGQATPAK